MKTAYQQPPLGCGQPGAPGKSRQTTLLPTAGTPNSTLSEPAVFAQPFTIMSATKTIRFFSSLQCYMLLLTKNWGLPRAVNLMAEKPSSELPPGKGKSDNLHSFPQKSQATRSFIIAIVSRENLGQVGIWTQGAKAYILLLPLCWLRHVLQSLAAPVKCFRWRWCESS